MVKDIVRGRISLELLQELEEFVPGGVLYRTRAPEEVRTVFARGKGSRVWDVDGNEYLDYVLGSGPMILGHAHPAITQAAGQRLEDGTQFFQATDVTLRHARKVLEAISGAEKIKYTRHRQRGHLHCPEAGQGLHRQDQDTEVRGRLPRDQRLHLVQHQPH